MAEGIGGRNGRSRLPVYVPELDEEIEKALANQIELNDPDEGYPTSSDEGYPTGPDASGFPDDTPFPFSGRPRELQDLLTNVLILRGVPRSPVGVEEFVRDCIIGAAIDRDCTIKLTKLPGVCFVWDLSDSDQAKLGTFMRAHYPQVKCDLSVGVPPYGYPRDTTDAIVGILTRKRSEMSYLDIYKALPRAWFLLTDDFRYDTERLVEVRRGDFYGMRLKRAKQIEKLDSRHLMSLIDVRSLAPLVHSCIAFEPRPLDRAFLERLERSVNRLRLEGRDLARVAMAVEGDALSKPLEHLITCVPGVEVVWTGNQKVIKKLELPERPGVENFQRSPATLIQPPEAARQEQDLVKVLSDILKQPSNLYMSLRDLTSEINRRGPNYAGNLRNFITERPKHFQILGEADYEVVTLSHRAQIKRVCNDLQKVLRPRKPKCIPSTHIATAFAAHWSTQGDPDRLNRRFNVEDFGVCYLDDLLVTIPQHWGVHCSEYVSTDGAVIQRKHGNGEEDIPEFVPHCDQVYAWIPRHHQTEAQKKSLALLKQQVLNMFRGDPSAVEFIDRLTISTRSHGTDHNRLLKLAYLRANVQPHHPVPSHARDNPTLPCNLELEEKTFVPLYHRFCGEQVALVHFGVKDLFELFDSMADTFTATGHGQDRKISLTADARREILERRLVDILRMTRRPMTVTELIQEYGRQPTMRPYFNQDQIVSALQASNLIEESPRMIGRLYHVRSIVECARSISALVTAEPDIRETLKIFMLSYAPLDVATVNQRFSESMGRQPEDTVLSRLLGVGAIRRVSQYTVLFDVHDVCRVVRNLVYKMNELPRRVYNVEMDAYLGMNPLPHRDISLASLLSFSGDFTFIEPEDLLEIMRCFSICFQSIGDTRFRLNEEMMIWVPAPEEVEGSRTPRPPGRLPHPVGRSSRPPRFPRPSPSNPNHLRGSQRRGGNNAH